MPLIVVGGRFQQEHLYLLSSFSVLEKSGKGSRGLGTVSGLVHSYFVGVN